MKKFMYLFLGGDMSSFSAEQKQQHMQKWGEWMKQLGKTGNFKAGDPLEAGATTLAGKAKTVTDGPFAEAKDVVGGYLLVTAEDSKHAVELAKGCPIFESGGRVEVRAVAEMNM